MNKLQITARLRTALLVFATALVLSACRSGGPAPPDGGDSQDPAPVLQVSMQPQPTIEPPFKGTGITFTPPAEMNTTGGGGGAVVNGDNLDKPAMDYNPDWMNNRVVVSDGFAVFMPEWVDAASGSPDQLSYCCYRFNVGQDYATDGGRQTLKLLWDEGRGLADAESQCCIALSNWGENKWTWFAGPADGVLTIETFAPFIGPEGQTLVVMAVMGTAEAALERVQIGEPELRGTGLLASEAPDGVSRADSVFRSTSADFPASFDLSSAMPPVRDQGQAGSCTSFAVGDSAFGYELNQLYEDFGWNRSDNFNRIGTRYIYVETGFMELPQPPPIFYPPLPEPTCNQTGRYTDLVFAFLRDNGCPVELHAPYSDQQCDRNWSQDALDDVPFLKINGFSSIQGQTSTTVNSIKDVLVNQNRPVVMGFQVDQAYVNLQPNQVWTFIGPSLGGHAVCIVGYDDAKNAFKIRNSWSTFWCDQGHAFINYSVFSGQTGAQLQTLFFLNGTFSQSVVDRFCPNPSGLQAPTNVAATDGTLTDRVRITWTAATGATSYKILRATSASGTFAQVGTSTTTTFDDPQPTTATFFYKVRGVSAGGDGPLSTADSGRAGLAAPTNFAASDGTFSDRIRMTWSAVTGATQYRIFRATSANGTFTQIGQTTATQFDSVLNNTTQFFYRAQASNSAGQSQFSTANSGFSGVAAPVNVAASDGAFADKVRITWTAVTGATGYKVFRSTNASTGFAQIGTQTAATFDDPQTPGSTFFYRIKTTATLGDSALSASDSGFAGTGAVPTVTATDGTLSDRIQITWTAVSGATGYKVFRSTTANGTFNQFATTTTALSTLMSTGLTSPVFFRVKATLPSGDTAFSNTDSGNAGVAAPTGVAASDGTFVDHIAVTWNAVAGATSYKIFRSATSNGTFTQVGTSSTTSFNDFITVGTFFYKVKAVAPLGDSYFSLGDGGSIGAG